MILNDLGLIFTQLVKYDEATDCFHEAWKLICHRHRELEHWLVAVVRQNLGASYNLTEKYQKAIECHEEAAAKYGTVMSSVWLIIFRNFQDTYILKSQSDEIFEKFMLDRNCLIIIFNNDTLRL